MNYAMSWEQYAPTSDSQLERLACLKAACGGEEVEAVRRNVTKPAQVPTLGNSVKPAGIAALYKESYGTRLNDGDEIGVQARERGSHLREYAETCQAFVIDIERAVHLLDTIAQQQQQVCEISWTFWLLLDVLTSALLQECSNHASTLCYVQRSELLLLSQLRRGPVLEKCPLIALGKHLQYTHTSVSRRREFSY